MGGVRLSAALAVGLVALVVAGYGFVRALGVGLCDSGDCPSEAAGDRYAALMHLGAAVFALSVLYIVIASIRARRRRRR